MAQQDVQMNLQKWAVQPTGTSGYEIPFQFGFEVLTTLYPDVVIGSEGTFRTMDVNTNVFAFPRAKRNTAADIKTDIKLGTEMSFDYTSGEYDNVKLDHQLAIAQVFQNFEIADTNADFVGFRVQEAVRQVARTYEDITIDDLISKGTQRAPIAKTGSTLSDVYKTVLDVKTQMILNGSDPSNLIIYVTPEVYQALYQDGIIMANGIGNIPASEIRNGYCGVLLGLPVFEAPRLSEVHHTFSGNKANMIVVDRSQVILLRRMVQPVVMERAPSTYPAECSLLKCLEYIKHYVVNSNGVYYLDLVTHE